MACLGRGALSENAVVASIWSPVSYGTVAQWCSQGTRSLEMETAVHCERRQGIALTADAGSFSCALRGVAIALSPYCFHFVFTGNPPLLLCHFFSHLPPFLPLSLNASSSFSLASFSGSHLDSTRLRNEPSKFWSVVTVVP